MLITFYGVNNIGKSTQAKLLVANLNSAGHKSVYLKFPIYDIEPTGPFINSVLRGSNSQVISEEELQMWFALNRFQFQSQLESYLKDNIIVVAEDYVGTSIAWGKAKGANQEWLESINQHLIREDLSILITGERSSGSIEKTHIHENNSQLISKVTEILLELAIEKKWTVVERQEKLPDTQNLILDIVKKHIN
jgi:thymidylate kinase